MSTAASGAKGLKTEELVRAYFLRAGFFVVRSVTLRHVGIELTDIDIWVYERSATLARRRTIIDVKDRKTPQAAERLFFVKGLASVIGVEGAGVATPDSRDPLRELARKQGVLWIDGTDIQRLKSSDVLSTQDRLSEEELSGLVAAVDAARGKKSLRESIDLVKSAVVDRFGAASANVAIESFRYCGEEAVKAHPGSPSALTTIRSSYFAAALIAASLDFASAETALRPPAERVRHMIDAIRLGADAEGAHANLRWAEAAIREYLPNGSSLAQVVRRKFDEEMKSIPAEGLAEIVVKLSNTDRLFTIAKSLEQAAYAKQFVRFDEINAEAKGFLGALLDFSNINRRRFAEACTTNVAGDQEPLGAEVNANAKSDTDIVTSEGSKPRSRSAKDHNRLL